MLKFHQNEYHSLKVKMSCNLIIGFRGLNIFPLVISSELQVKCVIKFGKFVRILEDQWKC